MMPQASTLGGVLDRALGVVMAMPLEGETSTSAAATRKRGRNVAAKGKPATRRRAGEPVQGETLHGKAPRSLRSSSPDEFQSDPVVTSPPTRAPTPQPAQPTAKTTIRDFQSLGLGIGMIEVPDDWAGATDLLMSKYDEELRVSALAEAFMCSVCHERPMSVLHAIELKFCNECAARAQMSPSAPPATRFANYLPVDPTPSMLTFDQA